MVLTFHIFLTMIFIKFQHNKANSADTKSCEDD